MRMSSSKSTPHSTSATPPARHSPSGSADNAVGRAATAAGGQGGQQPAGQPDNGGSWTGEMEGAASTPGTDRPQGVPVDTSSNRPKDGGPNHGNYKGG